MPDGGPQEPLCTLVPGAQPVELVAYYEEFRRYYPGCELATKAWVVRHAQPDWVVLDCGANVGYYAVLFARLCPRGVVHAFEPTDTIRMLERNVAHAGVTNVRPHRLALGKRSGVRRDRVYRVWGHDPDVGDYPFTTVDDFVEAEKLARVDCLKIDVDSFDFEVLQGSVATLRRFNPWLIVELNHALSRRGQNNLEALEWLTAQGYGEALVLDHDNFIVRRGEAVVAGEAGPTLSLRFGPRPAAG